MSDPKEEVQKSKNIFEIRTSYIDEKIFTSVIIRSPIPTDIKTLYDEKLKFMVTMDVSDTTDTKQTYKYFNVLYNLLKIYEPYYDVTDNTITSKSAIDISNTDILKQTANIFSKNQPLFKSASKDDDYDKINKQIDVIITKISNNLTITEDLIKKYIDFIKSFVDFLNDSSEINIKTVLENLTKINA